MILLLWACTGGGDPYTLTTQGGLYRIHWSTVPATIPDDALFELDADLTDAHTGAPVPDATLTVDARMPQHGHGMTTRPLTEHEGAHYVTKGMRFHMPGEWSVTFDVTGPQGTDHAEVPVILQ